MAKRPVTPAATSPGEQSPAGGGGPVRVRYPYGFLAADGSHRFWRAGQRVDDVGELALLRARGVELQED